MTSSPCLLDPGSKWQRLAVPVTSSEDSSTTISCPVVSPWCDGTLKDLENSILLFCLTLSNASSEVLHQHGSWLSAFRLWCGQRVHQRKHSLSVLLIPPPVVLHSLESSRSLVKTFLPFLIFQTIKFSVFTLFELVTAGSVIAGPFVQTSIIVGAEPRCGGSCLSQCVH